jgi:hypothetical protein
MVPTQRLMRSGGAAVSALLVSLLFAVPARAQRTPGSFLGLAPRLPENVCAATLEERTAFVRKVRELDEAIDKELRRRAAESKEAKAAEKAAAIEAGKQQQAGSLKHMSREDRKAWGMAHAGEMMARMKGGAPSDSGRYARMSELTTQSATEGTALGEKQGALMKRLEDLEESTRPSRAEIAEAAHRSTELGLVGSAAGAAEMDRRLRHLTELRRRFCARYSPRLLAILADYQDYTKEALVELERQEQREAEVKGMATGVTVRKQPGTNGLHCVKKYFRELSGVFKYDLEAADNGNAHG